MTQMNKHCKTIFSLFMFWINHFHGRGQVSFEFNYPLPNFCQVWHEAAIIHHHKDTGFLSQRIDLGIDKSTFLIYYYVTGNINFCKRYSFTTNPLVFSWNQVTALPDSSIMLNNYMGSNSAGT